MSWSCCASRRNRVASRNGCGTWTWTPTISKQPVQTTLRTSSFSYGEFLDPWLFPRSCFDSKGGERVSACPLSTSVHSPREMHTLSQAPLDPYIPPRSPGVSTCTFMEIICWSYVIILALAGLFGTGSLGNLSPKLRVHAQSFFFVWSKQAHPDFFFKFTLFN
jgi:hypothetical protein